MLTLLNDVAARASRYLGELRERPVFPDVDSVARLNEFAVPLQANPIEPSAVVAELDALGSPATVSCAGGRYFGFVTGGTLPAALAASMLATAWDQNAAMEVGSPIAAHLEKVSRAWLVQLLGLEPHCEVGFVTGATMANFTGLGAARHALLERQGWDVERDGLFGAPPITVVVGDEVHASLLKALGLLGLGRDRIVRVPVDQQGRLRASELPRIAGPTLVCVQAGNVNTGAFDPLDDIAQRIDGTGAWLHVDGAFGLWAAVSPRYSGLVHGIERADSIATDAHKWLNVPYDSGLVFVRDREALNVAMSASAAYLMRSETRDPHLCTPEMSRRARGVEVWAALRSLGSKGIAALIERNCAQAQRFASALREAGHEVLNEVVLNQVLVSFGEPKRTSAVIEAVQRDGTCWCGGTQWQGRTAMRISVSSWATTDDDVSMSIDAILRIARAVRES